MRILLVDDDEDSCEAMAEILELLGHKTLISRDGLSGVAKAASWHPDLVFLDIGLPDIDGYEVASRIRKDLVWGSVRIVALTGYGYDSDKAKAKSSGFDAHILKPPDITQIEAACSGPALH